MQYRAQRRPTDNKARLVAESGEYPVTVRNVSREGVRVGGVAGYVYPDAEVRLDVLGQRLAARVSWVDEDIVGLRFETPLSKDMEATIARGQVTSRHVRF